MCNLFFALAFGKVQFNLITFVSIPIRLYHRGWRAWRPVPFIKIIGLRGVVFCVAVDQLFCWRQVCFLYAQHYTFCKLVCAISAEVRIIF